VNRWIPNYDRLGRSLPSIFVDKHAVTEESLLKVHDAPYSALVKKEGDVVYAVDSDGKTIAEGSDDASVIRAAISYKKENSVVYIAPGTYNITGYPPTKNENGVSYQLKNFTLIIDGILCRNDSDRDIIHIDNSENVTIIFRGGYINGLNVGGTGLSFGSVKGLRIIKPRIINTVYDGIYMSACEKVYIEMPVIENVGNSGIELNPTDVGPNKNVVIENPVIYNAGVNGIGLGIGYNENITIINPKIYGCSERGIVGTHTRDLAVIGGQIHDNGYSGITLSKTENVKLIGVRSYNNGQAGGTYAGVELLGSAPEYCEHTQIFGGMYYDDQDTPTQSYGIWITGGARNTVVIGAKVYGNISEDLHDAGINSKIEHVEGYKNKNSGTATVSSGSTRVTVNHGLVDTPKKVHITPLSDPGDRYWVENRTPTSFDIVIATAPSSDVTFAWYAEV